MELTRRQAKIISFLIENGTTKCSLLSKKFNVSDKTIRNDIKEINTYNNNQTIIISSSEGFSVNEEALDQLQNISLSYDSQKLNSELLQHLIFQKNPTQFEKIAEYFQLSESALQSTISSLNEVCNEYELSIIRKKNNVILEGSNYNKRKLLLHLIHNETENSFSDFSNFKRYFPHLNIYEISEALIDAIDEYEYSIPKYYEKNLYINICALLSIPRRGKEEELIHNKNFGMNEYEISKQFFTNLGYEKDEDIIRLVASNLTGIITPNNYSNTNINSIENDCSLEIPDHYLSTINAIVRESFDHFAINVDYTSFINILINHIYNSILRINKSNPSIIESSISLKEDYSFVYEVAVFICKQLEEEYHVSFPDSEINLIAIHIGFAIETFIQKNGKITVAYYTYNHPIIEHYMINTVQAKYPNQIEFIELTSLNETKYITSFDVLITTKSTIPNKSYEYCKISPLLTNSDKAKIELAISNAVEKKKHYKFLTLINNCFDEKLFFYDTSFSNRDSVIKFLSLHLRLNNIVNDSFYDSVIKREQYNSTAFMNLYALPHSFDSNAISSKIAILINPEGITWGEQTVRFVFLIALNNNDKTYLQPLLDGFSNILSKNNCLHELDSVATFDGFVNFLTTHLT